LGERSYLTGAIAPRLTVIASVGRLKKRRHAICGEDAPSRSERSHHRSKLGNRCSQHQRAHDAPIAYQQQAAWPNVRRGRGGQWYCV